MFSRSFRKRSFSAEPLLPPDDSDPLGVDFDVLIGPVDGRMLLSELECRSDIL